MSEVHPRLPKIVTPIFIALILSIVMNAAGLIGIALVSTNTNEVVHYVKAQTSPERQRQQEKILNALLVQIDCNAAARLQRGFDSLAVQGLIKPVDVTENCGNR